MHLYDCSRCGMQFGSPSAVRMHLRKKHFNKTVCFHCGIEVSRKELKSHVEEHSCEKQIPVIYRPPPSTKRLKVPKETDNEDQTFWEDPGYRLTHFVAPCTVLKCRICGVILGGVHGREQHEKDVHKFTEQVKRSLALRYSSWNILDHLNPKDVTDYVKSDLKSRFCDTTECNSEINTVVDFLIAELPYQVSHIIRGGSYGKQTCLKQHSDLDMVLFVEGYPLFGGSSSSVRRLKAFLNEIKDLLQRSLLATRILISDVTSHSLRFQYQCVKNDHVHHIDLMPCNDLLGPRPNSEDKKALYELMANCKSEHELQLFNSSLIQLQIEFVRSYPRIVRDLIRFVKHWRRSSFGKTESLNRYRRLPNSYTLELVTIHAWEKCGKPIKFDLRQGLAAVLRELVQYEDLAVAWFDNYSRHSKWLAKTLTGTRPIVVDPANPLNNVCESTNCWDEVAYVARESLKRPLFKQMKSLKSKKMAQMNKPKRSK